MDFGGFRFDLAWFSLGFNARSVFGLYSEFNGISGPTRTPESHNKSLVKIVKLDETPSIIVYKASRR